MRSIRCVTSVVVLLCLIAFQVQAFARVALPCEHEIEISAGCQMHGAALQVDVDNRAPDQEGRQALDCVKCALILALGSLQVSPATESILSAPAGGGQSVIGSDHFYRFFPEQPARPPKHRLLQSRAGA
jgi:hypothetical protein